MPADAANIWRHPWRRRHRGLFDLGWRRTNRHPTTTAYQRRSSISRGGRRSGLSLSSPPPLWSPCPPDSILCAGSDGRTKVNRKKRKRVDFFFQTNARNNIERKKRKRVDFFFQTNARNNIERKKKETRRFLFPNQRTEQYRKKKKETMGFLFCQARSTDPRRKPCSTRNTSPCGCFAFRSKKKVLTHIEVADKRGKLEAQTRFEFFALFVSNALLAVFIRVGHAERKKKKANCGADVRRARGSKGAPFSLTNRSLVVSRACA